MHKQESVIENKSFKTLWDFEIQTEHSIMARKSDPVLINKKKKI